MISTVNGENLVDGIHKWNESDDESFSELDQSQATDKKLIKNYSRSQSMAFLNNPTRLASNQIT